MLQGIFRPHQKMVHFSHFFRGKIGYVTKVAVRGNEQMAVGVGIFIHHDKGQSAPTEDQAFPVLDVLVDDAENAPFIGRVILALQIGHSPGSPKLFHIVSVPRNLS
jgi:hypothetical protein